MADAIRARLGISRADALWVSAMLLVFGGLRAVAVRTTPVVYFDSAEYRHVELWGGRRPPTVPLLFWLAPSDRWRVFEQALISSAAWITLALVVAAGVNDRRVRLFTIATVLTFGLTTQITNWDSAILSDSITISLTAFLIAAWIAFHRSPSLRTGAAVIVVTLLWMFTRELHVYITAVIAVVFAVVAVFRRTGLLRLAVALGLLLVAMLGVFQSRSSTETAVQNLAGVLGARVLPDAGVREWFEQEGMPFMPQLRTGQQHPDKALLAIPEFTRWAERSGWLVYGKFVLTHPDQAIEGPYRELLEERPAFGDTATGRPVLLSPTEAYGTSRPVLPSVIEDLLFAPGKTGAVVWFAAVTIVAAVLVTAQRGSEPRIYVPLVVVILSLLYVAMAWHGSVFEPGRHSMPAAVAVRLGLLVLAVAVVDRALIGRHASTDNLVT